MNEIDALVKIAESIQHLANAVGVLGTVAWLTFFLKTQNSNDGAEKVARALDALLQEWKKKK